MEQLRYDQPLAWKKKTKKGFLCVAAWVRRGTIGSPSSTTKMPFEKRAAEPSSSSLSTLLDI